MSKITDIQAILGDVEVDGVWDIRSQASLNRVTKFDVMRAVREKIAAGEAFVEVQDEL